MELAWGQITISSIFSLILGVFLGHRLALGRDRKKEVVAAASEFREAFVELQRLLLLRHPNHPGGDEFQKTWKLMPKFHNQLTEAKVRFTPFLSTSQSKILEKYWVELWNIEGEIPAPNINKYRTSEDHHEELAMRDSVLNIINKLIN